jgi:hypothetical protein
MRKKNASEPIVAIEMEGTETSHLTGVKAQRARGGFITMPSPAICNGGFDVRTSENHSLVFDN